MRCTRCDGLAVPQAVGLAPDGKVVFGWCLTCLAEASCHLVEVSSSGPLEFRLSVPEGSGGRRNLSTGNSTARTVDQTQWIVAIVAFLLIGWGLLLVAAGLYIGSRPATDGSPLGNGTAPLLGVGGTATALLGLGLLILASRRNWLPAKFPLSFVSWLGFLVALGILACGIIDYEPRRNVPVVLAAGLALTILVVTRRLERSRRERPPQVCSIPQPRRTATGLG